jgi:hypothetical protein
MRHYPIASSILFALALGACSKSNDSTELAVTVWSDLSVPLEMDALRIQVTGEQPMPDQLYRLSADQRPGTYQIPVQLVLAPTSSNGLSIRVTATGSFQGADIVSQEAVLSFIPGQARELVLNLAQSCENVSCAAHPGYTCENGACTRPVVVDTAALPTYVPGQVAPSPDPGIVSQHSDASVVSQQSDAATGAGGYLTGSGGDSGTGGGVTIKLDAPSGTGGSGGDTGTGGSRGLVTVDQVLLNFGTLDVGAVSAPKTVTVTVTVAPVSINATVIGDGFAISANTCAPMQPVGTCTISVVFAPTKQGASPGELDVGSIRGALSGTAGRGGGSAGSASPPPSFRWARWAWARPLPRLSPSFRPGPCRRWPAWRAALT